MSGKTFKEKSDLEGLFELWKARQVREIEEDVKPKLANHKITKENFEELVYTKRNNTISSHFVQFFDNAKCEECITKTKGLEGIEIWETVLKNAFNMDGTYANFYVKKGGYKYICLLKEANDSEKTCVVKDYLNVDETANKWVVEETNIEGNCACQRRYNAPMLEKLNQAFVQFREDACEDFKDEMAFMNVNKRGGTSTTAGRNETAVINYAQKYREFILKEMDILREHKDNDVTVFVCGNKNYFKRLMIALFPDSKEKIKSNVEKNYDAENNMKFTCISHPSNWRVSARELAGEMGGKTLEKNKV